MLRIVIAILLIALFAISISCASSSKAQMKTSTNRAIHARLAEADTTSRQLEIIYRKKIVHVFRIMHTSAVDAHGKSIYDKLKKLKVTDDEDWSRIDSIIKEYYSYMDSNNNPDTKENEFYQDLQQRIKYCDTYFGKWWMNNDMRANVVIQLGVDGMGYHPPYEAGCISTIGELKKTGLCLHCQISYPNRGIYIQLQGNFALNYFDEIVAWVDQGSEYLARTEEDMKQDFQAAKQEFHHTVMNREEPPAFNPLPEAKKDISLAWQIFQRQVSRDAYEVWSTVALPLEQFTPDSNGNINFQIKQIVRETAGFREITDSSQTAEISLPYSKNLDGSWYFAAVKNVLPPGKWQIVVTPTENGTKNKTIYSYEVTVPEHNVQKGISDILLYLDQPVDKKDQVVIGEHQYTGLPFRSFKRTDTLRALVTAYKLPPQDSSLVVWYLSPVKDRKRVGKTHVEIDSVFWSQMQQSAFPVLKFLEKTDMVLGFEHSQNHSLYSVNSSLASVPPDEYIFSVIIVEPRLRTPIRVSRTRIMVR